MLTAGFASNGLSRSARCQQPRQRRAPYTSASRDWCPRCEGGRGRGGGGAGRWLSATRRVQIPFLKGCGLDCCVSDPTTEARVISPQREPQTIALSPPESAAPVSDGLALAEGRGPGTSASYAGDGPTVWLGSNGGKSGASALKRARSARPKERKCERCGKEPAGPTCFRCERRVCREHCWPPGDPASIVDAKCWDCVPPPWVALEPRRTPFRASGVVCAASSATTAPLGLRRAVCK